MVVETANLRWGGYTTTSNWRFYTSR